MRENDIMSVNDPCLSRSRKAFARRLQWGVDLRTTPSKLHAKPAGRLVEYLEIVAIAEAAAKVDSLSGEFAAG